MENLIELFDGYALRAWRLSDVDSFLSGISHPDISKNLRSEFPRTREQVLEFIENALLKDEIQDFAIVEGDDLVGGISFIIHQNQTIELSCLWVAASYRHKGIAPNTIMILASYIRQKYLYYEVLGRIYAFNKVEIRMVERLGFVRTDSTMVPYHGGYTELLCYKYCYS